ncbi:MAG: hypothetical protein LBV55_02795 [Acholeplasmatales bacterium]|jgi:hypothetical protein|nr:hypothetical protein [Acholeplasmatales bacterium]
MQKEDELKLIYQACFGPGHLISNPQESLTYLQEEVKMITLNPPKFNNSLLEDIGNNFVRVYLLPFISKKYQLENLNAAFVASANLNIQATQLYKSLTNQSPTGPIHHSQIYNDNYQPHYRVIHRQYLDIIRRK